MSVIDKNQAVINYLLTCSSIQNSVLYFNFIHSNNHSTGFNTLSNDKQVEEDYIDGSKLKKYSLTITSLLAISDNPVPKSSGYTHENVSTMAEVQTLMDWIKTQENARNYPSFGTNCVIQSIETTTDNPKLNLIDATSNPPLAKYSFTIDIKYIDNTDKLWN